MKVLKLVIVFLLAFLMLLGSFNHIYAPETYAAFIPEFISENLANILSTVAEAIVGIALIIPKYRKWADLVFVY